MQAEVSAPTLDVVIPVYNATTTLCRAVESVVAQPQVNMLWLIDDGSTDASWPLMQQLARKFDGRIHVARLNVNGGVAAARNCGLWRSGAELIAFLDADDAYLPGALEVPHIAMRLHPQIGLVRLGLQPIGFPEKYLQHDRFAHAWQVLQMTVGGNTVFRRSLLLACGGFPEDALFRRLGGEDGALGIALTQLTTVGTLFDEPGVEHHYHAGMHAERLLDLHLWNKADPRVQPADLVVAEEVTARIVQQVQGVRRSLAQDQGVICPLLVQRAPVTEPTA